MADICTTSISPNSCDHRQLSGVDNGEPWTLHLHENDIVTPLTIEEDQILRTLALRKLRQTGLTLAQMAGRVIRGEEATNVKAYNLLGPGAAITKTNIGTSYVNICLGFNGERSLIDFTGCTEFRIIISANLVGTGPFGFRLVRDSDSAVLFENASIALTGERELDTDWVTLPGAANGLSLVRAQAKSTTAADDPIVRRFTVLVR